jgi:hypothetical protein
VCCERQLTEGAHDCSSDWPKDLKMGPVNLDVLYVRAAMVSAEAKALGVG